MPVYKFNMFGGINYADDAAGLLLRSHGYQNGVWSHKLDAYGRPVGVEAAKGQNFDLERGNLLKRRGSTSYADFTVGDLNIFLTADVVVLGPVEVLLPATGAYARFVVSKKTIYTDQSGTWVQINNSGGTAYTHADQTVTSASIVVTDGGVLIGLNKGNKIQHYRSGTGLQAALDNGNNYTDSGGTVNVVTGTWGTGYDRLAVFNGRLVFNDGTSTVQYTDVNQPWDLAGGGNFPAEGSVIGLRTHIPQFATVQTAILYIGTSVGWNFTSDLAVRNNINGSPAPINDKSIIETRNWIMYLTARGDIYGINGNRVIDLGRRLKARDGTTGPLDTINLANSLTVANGYYDDTKTQAGWLISTAASGNPNATVVIDLQLGEPVLDEPLTSYEQHVRCLKWAGQDYVSVQYTQSGLVGARSTGIFWTLDSGYSDYGATAITKQWFSPLLDGGAPANPKSWMVWFGRGVNAGSWNVQGDYLRDRDNISVKTFQFGQGGSEAFYDTDVYDTGLYSAEGLITGSDDTDIVSETLQIELSQSAAAQNCTITSMEQHYDVLVEERG